MALDPRIEKDAGGAYWLRWVPDPTAEGYAFVTPGGKSRTFDSTRKEAKLGKNLAEPVVASVAVLDMTTRAAESASYPPVAPSPAALHKHRLTVYPGGTDPNSGAGNNYCACWGKFRSSTTRYVNDDNSRTIAWGPGELYEDKNLVVLWEWWPEQGVKPGRVFNPHNHPNYGGWQPGNSNGVSAVALDWRSGSVYEGQSGLLLKLEAAGATGRKVWTVATDAEVLAAQAAGTSLQVRLDITIGNPNGRVICWMNGQQRFDTGLRPTHWPSQTGYSLWEGIYNSNGLGAVEQHSYTPARLGRNLPEATADVPTEARVMGTVYKSNGQPNWKHEVIVP